MDAYWKKQGFVKLEDQEIKSKEEAINLISAFPVGSYLFFHQFSIIFPDDESQPPTVRMAILKQGYITEKSNDNTSFTVQVEGAANIQNVKSKGSTVNQKIVISAADLVTDKKLIHFQGLPRSKIIIKRIKIPKQKNETSQTSNSRTEGGRRKTRKYKKSKKQSKKQTRRHK